MGYFRIRQVEGYSTISMILEHEVDENGSVERVHDTLDAGKREEKG